MKTTTSKSGQARQANPWHAVGIVCPEGSCAAAIACHGQRFLAAKAPGLPLAGCTQPQLCRCTYRHYQDRRVRPRRAGETGGPPRALKSGADQRVKRGRRSTDF
jgi:hypothetical protein